MPHVKLIVLARLEFSNFLVFDLIASKFRPELLYYPRNASQSLNAPKIQHKMCKYKHFTRRLEITERYKNVLFYS